MSRSARAAKGFAASVFQFCAQMLIQVVLAPVVLKVAGRETLGAFAAIMQALGFLAILDVVGNWALERFLGQATGLDDGGTRFRTIFTTARTVYLFINAAFAMMVLLFSAFVGRLFHMSPAIALEARHALYVLAVWTMVVRPVFAAYNNALVAIQDIAAANLISALGMVVRAVAALGFVLMGGGLFGLILAGTAGEGVVSVLYRVRFKKLHPDLMPGWGLPDRALMREMLSFGGHSAVVNAGSNLMFSSGNTLAGMTNGAAAASSFYTTQMPTLAIYNLLNRMNGSTMPALNELYGRRDLERVRQTFIRLIRVLLLMLFPLAMGVLLFNRDIVDCWVGPKQYAGTLMTAALSLYCIVNGLQGIATQYAVVFGWVRFLAVAAIMQGIVNFGLGFYLGRHLGLGGITLALVVVLLPTVVILLHKIGLHLELSTTALMTRCAIRSVIPLAAASALGFLAHSLVHLRIHHFGPLLIEGAAFVPVYFALAYFMSMEDQDRNDIKRAWSAMLNRGHGAGKRVTAALGR